MKKLLLLGIAAVALVAAGPAQAALTLSGPTGLADIPTAEVAPAGSVNIAADYVNTEDFFIPIRATIGLLEGLEVGGSYVFYDADDFSGFAGHAKYVVPIQVFEGLSIAGGGLYSVTSTPGPDDITALNVYGVVTYGLELEGIGLKASGGVDYLSMDFGPADDSGIGFFAGLEVGVFEGLALFGEFHSENGDLANDATSFGVRYTVMDALTVQAGMTEIGDHELFVGAQYSLNLFGN